MCGEESKFVGLYIESQSIFSTQWGFKSIAENLSFACSSVAVCVRCERQTLPASRFVFISTRSKLIIERPTHIHAQQRQIFMRRETESEQKKSVRLPLKHIIQKVKHGHNGIPYISKHTHRSKNQHAPKRISNVSASKTETRAANTEE